MTFHFSIYSCGSTDAVQYELAGVEAARAEAFRLSDQATRAVIGELRHGQQVRVVVSDAQGLDLFTLVYLSSNGEMRHDLASRGGEPASAIVEDAPR